MCAQLLPLMSGRWVSRAWPTPPRLPVESTPWAPGLCCTPGFRPHHPPRGFSYLCRSAGRTGGFSEAEQKLDSEEKGEPQVPKTAGPPKPGQGLLTVQAQAALRAGSQSRAAPSARGPFCTRPLLRTSSFFQGTPSPPGTSGWSWLCGFVFYFGSFQLNKQSLQSR